MQPSQSSEEIKNPASTSSAVPHPQDVRRLPQPGEMWAYRTSKPKKIGRPYQLCRIIRRCSTQTYRIITKRRKQKTVHLRYLKPLTAETIADISSIPDLPEDERPLRDLVGGRGRVES